MLCGGAGAPKEADEEVQALCDQIREDLETKAGRTFTHFKAHKVSSQVVAGMNYFVKIRCGDDEFVHVRIYKPLPGQGDVQLNAHQLNKTADDPIGYFQD